jgi:hypothetical protein
MTTKGAAHRCGPLHLLLLWQRIVLAAAAAVLVVVPPKKQRADVVVTSNMHNKHQSVVAPKKRKTNAFIEKTKSLCARQHVHSAPGRFQIYHCFPDAVVSRVDAEKHRKRRTLYSSKPKQRAMWPVHDNQKVQGKCSLSTNCYKSCVLRVKPLCGRDRALTGLGSDHDTSAVTIVNVCYNCLVDTVLMRQRRCPVMTPLFDFERRFVVTRIALLVVIVVVVGRRHLILGAAAQSVHDATQ